MHPQSHPPKAPPIAPPKAPPIAPPKAPPIAPPKAPPIAPPMAPPWHPQWHLQWHHLNLSDHQHSDPMCCSFDCMVCWCGHLSNRALHVLESSLHQHSMHLKLHHTVSLCSCSGSFVQWSSRQPLFTFTGCCMDCRFNPFLKGTGCPRSRLLFFLLPSMYCRPLQMLKCLLQSYVQC